MNIEAEEETKVEMETNAEADTVATIIVKDKKADAEGGHPQLPHKYFHTHRFCAHISTECETKGSRHKKTHHSKHAGRQNLELFKVVTMWDQVRI